MDAYEEIEHELNHEKHEVLIARKLKIAIGYCWSLSNFKRFISQFLKIVNTEDQWTWDYECWLEHIPEGYYEHPAIWAQNFYGDRWDTAKMEKSIKSIREIASKSKPA